MATFRQEQIDDILNYDRAMNRIVLDSEIAQASRFNDERNPPSNRDIKFEALLGTLVDDLKAKIAEALQSIASKQYPKTDALKVTALLGLPTGEKHGDFKNMNYAAVKRAQDQQSDFNYAQAKIRALEANNRGLPEDGEKIKKKGVKYDNPTMPSNSVPVPRNTLTEVNPQQEEQEFNLGSGKPSRKRKFMLRGGADGEETADGLAKEKSVAQAHNATENILYDIVNKYNGIVDKLLQATQPDGRFSSKRNVSASSVSYFSDVLKGVLEPLKHLVFELAQVHNPSLASVINMVTSMIEVIDNCPPFQKVNVLSYKSGMPDFQGLSNSVQLLNVDGYIKDLETYKARMREMYHQAISQSSAMFFNIPNENLRNSLRNTIEERSKQYKKVIEDIDNEIVEVRARAKLTDEFEANGELIKQAEGVYEAFEELVQNGEPERQEMIETQENPSYNIIKLPDENYKTFLGRLDAKREELQKQLDNANKFAKDTGVQRGEDDEYDDIVNKLERAIGEITNDIGTYENAINTGKLTDNFNTILVDLNERKKYLRNRIAIAKKSASQNLVIKLEGALKDVLDDIKEYEDAMNNKKPLRLIPETRRAEIQREARKSFVQGDLESHQREAEEARLEEEARKLAEEEERKKIKLAEKEAKKAEKQAKIAEKKAQHKKEGMDKQKLEFDNIINRIQNYEDHNDLKKLVLEYDTNRDIKLLRKKDEVVKNELIALVKSKYPQFGSGRRRKGGSGGLADLLSTDYQPQNWHHRKFTSFDYDDKIHNQMVKANDRWQRLSNPPHTTPIGNLIPFYKKDEASMYSFPMKLKNENAKLYPDDTQTDARGADISLLQGPIGEREPEENVPRGRKPRVTHRTAKEATMNILEGRGEMGRGIGMGKPSNQRQQASTGRPGLVKGRVGIMAGAGPLGMMQQQTRMAPQQGMTNRVGNRTGKGTLSSFMRSNREALSGTVGRGGRIGDPMNHQGNQSAEALERRFANRFPIGRGGRIGDPMNHQGNQSAEALERRFANRFPLGRGGRIGDPMNHQGNQSAEALERRFANRFPQGIPQKMAPETGEVMKGKGKKSKALHKIVFDDEANDMFDEEYDAPNDGGMIPEESEEEEDRFRNKKLGPKKKKSVKK